MGGAEATESRMPVSEPTIDEYLAGVADPELRATLAHLRSVIAAVAPAAEEGRSYGMPAFRYRGRPLVAFQAAARHGGFYPMSPALIEAHATELAEFDTSKGTIRFTPDRPIPDELVRTIVRERLAELDASRAARRS
jgi:uncharacterized protein YdhG (YjbR/CyaY superfamily)